MKTNTQTSGAAAKVSLEWDEAKVLALTEALGLPPKSLARAKTLVRAVTRAAAGSPLPMPAVKLEPSLGTSEWDQLWLEWGDFDHGPHDGGWCSLFSAEPRRGYAWLTSDDADGRPTAAEVAGVAVDYVRRVFASLPAEVKG